MNNSQDDKTVRQLPSYRIYSKVVTRLFGSLKAVMIPETDEISVMRFYSDYKATRHMQLIYFCSFWAIFKPCTTLFSFFFFYTREWISNHNYAEWTLISMRLEGRPNTLLRFTARHDLNSFPVRLLVILFYPSGLTPFWITASLTQTRQLDNPGLSFIVH